MCQQQCLISFLRFVSIRLIRIYLFLIHSTPTLQLISLGVNESQVYNDFILQFSLHIAVLECVEH